MSVLKATTTVSVLRAHDAQGTEFVDRLAASYDDEAGGLATGTRPKTVVARGVRANIGTSRGLRKVGEVVLGGDQETIFYHMQCDPVPVDVLPTDQIRDERSGLIYDVEAAVLRNAFPGREYMQVSLVRTRGAA
jgi:hypothetical protein